jgi:signal transduction histidine kinase
LKDSEKKLLIFNTFFICLLIFFVVFIAWNMSNLDISMIVKSIIFIILVMVTIIFAYLLSKFFLHRLFETNKLLDLLLKDTLHELNIPLSVIKANTQMLKSNENDTKNINQLRRIDKACDELYGLYEDVDYYIKKQSKRDVRESFSLYELVKNEADKFKNIYENTNIVVSHTTLHVNIDKRGFRKVVGNLISNALKYNKNNNKIEIYVKDSRLFIQDHGIGMSEPELFLVFNRYYQSEVEQTGYGIGLSIVKTFCDDNKIYINIESKPNTGTKISLDLSNLL